ncbi:MAG: hypothetical protein QNJ14_12220 [Woeseiaceae bacterium]|nr:hypothetical protein [Woeseiaceae bacterium]
MSIRLRQLLLSAALVMLGVRALTPLGYMPATVGEGLLYELCPEGMPAEIMHALSGGGHHHHHGGESQASAESCPIGHMLASAMAVDLDSPIVVIPKPGLLEPSPQVVAGVRAPSATRCRSPPA